jgi:hypothetical protein
MNCPIEERCLSSDEIIEEGRRLEHPEWWPDEVLDVCKARLQEGIVTPAGDLIKCCIWESCLIEAESPTIQSLLTALYDGLDEDFDES